MKTPRKFLLTNLLYLKVFIAFGLGIVVSENVRITWLLLCLPILLFMTLYSTYHFLGTNRSKLGDSLTFSLIFLCGIMLHTFRLHEQETSMGKIQPVLNREALHLARIEDKPVKKSNTIQVECTLLRSEVDSIKLRTLQRILVYLPLKNDISPLYYGQVLQLKGRLAKPSSPHYDFEFDYAKWLSRKNIYTTLYAPNYMQIGQYTHWIYLIRKMPLKIRDYFEHQIDQAIPNKSVNSIAKSILIGVRTDIDKELYTAYANTGTVHILSISGLHFGILILFLEYLLKFIIKKESLRFGIKHSTSFMYAVMTGFSAPIMRSFIMFLFLDIAKWKQMRISSYNILFLSAWLILLYDTSMLFDIGFQFSYMALLGIMLIYQRAVWKIEFHSLLANFIWKSIITLFAAWLFTSPLTIYYYHKFSFLGSLSNLLVVPLTTAIMYTGFTFILLSKIALLSKFLGTVLTILITLQNQIIQFFDQLPLSNIPSNALDGWGLTLTLFFIGMILTLFYTKSRTSLRWSLICFSILFLQSSFNGYKRLEDEKWFLTSNYKNSAIVYKNKNEVHIFADSVDENMRNYFIQRLTTYYGITSIIVHSKFEYLAGKANHFSYQLEAQPTFLVLAKENINDWSDYIDRRDSFIIMSNTGWHKSKLLESLKEKKKYFNVY